MPIRQHLNDVSAFEPDALAAMSTAFEEECAALPVFAGDTKGREIIAARVIDLARIGVVGAATLRDRVLMEARVRA